MQTSQSLIPTDRLQQLLPELFNPTPTSGEQFLRLSLTPNLTIALALSWIEETLLMSTQRVTPMPNMPPHVLGLMSSKGQVFWVINLAQLLELPLALEPSQYYEVVIIRALPMSSDPASDQSFLTPDTQDRQLFLGLVVPKIRGSIRLSREDIASPIDQVDANLQPYLSGQVVIDGKPIFILSAEAIGAAQTSM